MNYQQFARLYSFSRVSRYKKAAKGNKEIAQRMYYANMRIAQAFQPLIGSFEVILRNQLHYKIASYFNDVQWLIHQKTGFMSDSSLIHINKKTGKRQVNDFLKKEVERSEKSLIDKNRNVVAGRIIAELNFGFWNSLYEKHHYALLKGIPCGIFKTLPKGYGRKEVNHYIQEIRILRNRISHNEPICFKDKKFSLEYVQQMHKMICDFFTWIDPCILPTLRNECLDNVEKEIDLTKNLISTIAE